MNTSASSQPTARTRFSSAPTSTDGYPSGVTAETIRLDRRITDLTDRVNLINGRRRPESHMEATDEKITTGWLDEQEQRIDGLEERMERSEKRMERSERETKSRNDRVERFMRGVANFLGTGQSEAWVRFLGEATGVTGATETTGRMGTIPTTTGVGLGGVSSARLDWFGPGEERLQ